MFLPGGGSSDIPRGQFLRTGTSYPFRREMRFVWLNQSYQTNLISFWQSPQTGNVAAAFVWALGPVPRLGGRGTCRAQLSQGVIVSVDQKPEEHGTCKDIGTGARCIPGHQAGVLEKAIQ